MKTEKTLFERIKDFKGFKSPAFVTFSILGIILILVPVLAPVIAPHDPTATDYAHAMIPFSTKYLLGTDQLGRCILSRLIWGGRTSMLVIFAVVAIIAVVGILLGVIAGISGGKVDFFLSRVTDIVMAVPQTVFVIALVAVLGASLPHTIMAMSLVGWTEYFRVTRGLVLSIKEEPYVEAARLGGLNRRQIIRRVLLPNAFPYLIVNITQDIGNNLLTLSGLSVLGLSSQPPTPEWGSMLSEGQAYIQTAPWLIIYPGLVVVLNVIVFNLLGDSLRDVLDPKFIGSENTTRFSWFKRLFSKKRRSTT